MPEFTGQRFAEVAPLCRRFGVRQLELFGSGATAEFDLETSDLDFLVTFGDLPADRYADSYFGLKEALEDLFRRPVDLVVASAITNPYFLQGIAATRATLYAA